MKQEIDSLIKWTIRGHNNISPINKHILLNEEEFRHQKEKQEQYPILGASLGIILLKNEHVILTKRNKVHAGWALPGGRVEISETFESTLIRELEEECGVQITIGSILSLENKKYLSPNDQSIELWVATFIGYSDDLPIQTQIATEEGLIISHFDPKNLPNEVAKDDLEKIQLFLNQ